MPNATFGEVKLEVLKAVGMALAEMAFADNIFDEREIKQIERSMRIHASVDENFTNDIITSGMRDAQQGIISQYNRHVIKTTLNQTQKVLFLQMLFEVAIADGIFEESEKLKIKEYVQYLSLDDETLQSVTRNVLMSKNQIKVTRLGISDAQVLTAIGVLLTELALADKVFDRQEKRRIGLLLAYHMAATPPQIFNIFEQVAQRQHQHDASHAFAKDLQQKLTYPQKLQFIDMLVDVAHADGVFSQDEHDAITTIGD